MPTMSTESSPGYASSGFIPTSPTFTFHSNRKRDETLRKAVAEKIKRYNNIDIDADARPFEVMVTNGGTGALIGIAQAYLRGKSALVFEPYYPYHRRILEEFGGKTETFELDENLHFEKDALHARAKELKDRSEYPLKAIIVCTPANPSGKVPPGQVKPPGSPAEPAKPNK